jgi:chromosome segregation ATPase
MNSVQESKNELEAAIRYAENAISSAKQTIESMEFRQELAKKQYAEQTGREQALEAENAKLREDNERLTSLEIQLRDKIRELKAQVKQ